MCDPPLLINAWKGHFASVVSIDLAEDKELIVTASTDRCVCLWTIKGRYIGECYTLVNTLHFSIALQEHLVRSNHGN